MVNLRFFIVFFAILLMSCTKGTAGVSDAKDIVNYTDSGTSLRASSGYSIRVPKEMFIYGSKRFFSTVQPPKEDEYPIYDDLLDKNDYDLRLIDSPPSCAPELIGDPPVTALGVSKPKVDKDEDGNIQIWGKVDFWDLYGHDYEPDREPVCRPPEQGAGYAFCSQKEEKTVTICISQQTDDPALAEGIFKSFRWVE